MTERTSTDGRAGREPPPPQVHPEAAAERHIECAAAVADLVEHVGPASHFGGDIDEIVLHRPEFVHVEQMNDRDWWIGIAMPDGSEFSGHFHATSRGVMTFGLTESDIEWDKDDEHPEVGP